MRRNGDRYLWKIAKVLRKPPTQKVALNRNNKCWDNNKENVEAFSETLEEQFQLNQPNQPQVVQYEDTIVAEPL